MAKWQDAPLVGGAYTLDSPFAHQECVNWMVEAAERPNARGPARLIPVPGCLRFAALSNDTTGADDRIRGVRNVENRLYVVCGQSLFTVNTDGTVETVDEGNITGDGLVKLTHNQEAGGYSLVISNGSKAWTYNSGTGVFAQITDEGFPGFKTCDFLDQYIVGISPDGLFAFHSELANAAEYNTLDRYAAESAPDRLVGQIVDHGQWWLFGERTIEVYTNVGTATGTFQRIPGSSIERGLCATFAVAKIDNSVFWVGDDRVVYRANGYTPVRISTHAIERDLSGVDGSKIRCEVYEDRGHKVLYVHSPDGRTWGYDVATGEWHRRQSYGRSNWRLNSLVNWAGGWFAGDELSNYLQRIHWGYQDEDGQPLIVERVSGILHGNENRVQVQAVKVVIDSGRAADTVPPLRVPIYPVDIYNALSSASVGVPVAHNYLGRFGVPPYTFSLDLGTLPTGLSLSATGALTGTPTAAGSFAWRVKITDSLAQTDTLDQGIDIPLGIDDGSGVTFDVTEVDAVLITNTDGFTGGPAALSAGVAFNSPSGSGAHVVRRSPDGVYAAFSSRSDTGSGKFGWRKWNAGTEAWDSLADPADMPTVGPYDMAWSNGGDYLACAVFDASPNNVVIYQRSGDTLTKVAQSVLPANNCYWVAWSADDSMLAVGNGSSATGVYVFDISLGVLSNARTGNTGALGNQSAFSPDGSYIAAATRDSGLYVFSIGPSSLTLVHNIGAAATPLAWAGCWWNSSGIITVADQGSPGSDFVQTWTFNGTTIALAGAPASQPAVTCLSSDLTADGRFLVTASSDNNVNVFDLSTFSAPALVETEAVTATLQAVAWGGL